MLFCYNFVDHIRQIGDEPIREVLKQLGGWPVITENWITPNFSIEHLLGRIRGVYNEGFIIEQWVGPDDKNSSMNIIQVSIRFFSLNPSTNYTVCKQKMFFIW